jgi:hypothetical protein
MIFQSRFGDYALILSPDDDSDGCVRVPVAEINDKNATPFVLMALEKST